MTSLVFERPIDGHASHALVIGVGSYSFVDRPEAQAYHVPPLYSAPESARRFCNWLFERQDRLGPPLASIRLLLADPRVASGTPVNYTRPDNQTFAVDCCYLDTINDGFSEWYDVINDPEVSSLFFFSGHGFYNGRVYGLAEDFARSVQDPFAKIISFNEFYEGMEQCAAYQQLFFVDCCQGLSDVAIDSYDGVDGTSLVKPKPSALQDRLNKHGRRGAYRMFATSPGIETEGDRNGISDFTTVLLDCLKGRAAEKPGNDEWWITTKNLQEAVELCAEEKGWPHLDAPDVRGNRTLKRLHCLDGPPEIPVRIRCDPVGATRSARLVLTDAQGAVVLDDPPNFRLEPLGPFLAAVDYQIKAKFNQPANFEDGFEEFDVMPPAVEVIVKTPRK